MIVWLAFLGFFALAGGAIYLAHLSAQKTKAALAATSRARGWTYRDLPNWGGWEMTASVSGLVWRLASEPNEEDSDRDLHTVLTAELPFPDYARLEVMPRLAWNAMRSGIMQAFYKGALSHLTEKNPATAKIIAIMSLEEIIGIGEPEFAEFYAVAGDSKTAYHLLTPELNRLLLSVKKPLRISISIHGRDLILRSSGQPLPKDVILTMAEVGTILLRQASTGQRLSA